MSDNLKELNKNEHMSWDEYFINILKAVSLRATCNRGKAACVFVRDNIILSTGYVGSPRGFEDCDHSGHLLKCHLQCCETGHLPYRFNSVRLFHSLQSLCYDVSSDWCQKSCLLCQVQNCNHR